MEIFDKENFLKKTVIENFDMFDTLRTLNADNVNQHPTERDDLFSSLTVVENINDFDRWLNRNGDNFLKTDYLRGKIKISVDDSINLFGMFNVEAAFKHYAIGNLSFEENCIMNDCGPRGYNSPNLMPLMGLICVRKRVMEDSSNFNSFKTRIIEFMLKKVCEDRSRNLNHQTKEVINKLMVILAEHVNQTSASGDYPWVLSDKLLDELGQIDKKSDWTKQIVKHTLENTAPQLKEEQKSSTFK